MAAKLILPGMGGAYRSEVFSAVSANSIATDTLDLSRCGSFAIQFDSRASITGTVQLEQTFNGGDAWTSFGSAITLSSGATVLFEESDAPFGIMRLRLVSITVGTTAATIVGFPGISW